MKYIFEEGYFSNYANVNLRESMSPILEEYHYGRKKTTVFISHKHSDLNELKGLLGFLENEYEVRVYIDSKDPTMPKITSAETASNIKERIIKCDKFILLATHGAIESKWCNWELGYGDAQKFKKHIALFPMKPKGINDKDYVGSEYMRIYPYITYFDGTEFYSNGKPIQKGYYVRNEEKDCYYITPLAKWFDDK